MILNLICNQDLYWSVNKIKPNASNYGKIISISNSVCLVN